MIQPVATEVPIKKPIATAMTAIQMKHEANKRIRIRDGWKKEVNND